MIPATASRKLSQPASSSRACQRVGSGQVALKVLQTLLHAGDLVTILAVERRFGHRRVQILHGLLELFNPARHAVQLFAFLEAQLAGLFTGGIRRFLPGNIRIRPRLGGRLRGALAEIVVVASFILFHQAIVLDDQRLATTSFRKARSWLTSNTVPW